MRLENFYEEYSTKEHWERFWTGIQPTSDFKPCYHRLLRKILPPNKSWTAFEVGCVPGNYLMYFYTHYGYKPSGIDYSDRTEEVRNYFEKQGIKAEIHKQDFFTFKTRKKYNLVYSNGFVEHFGNPELVFKKHLDLLAKGGYLIISLPNFRNMQYYLHSIFDSRTLKTHNFSVMEPDLWRKLAEKYGLKIHYCNYYETFNFWVVNKSLMLKPFVKMAGFANKALHFILKLAGLKYIPNKQLSPNIVLVAQK